MTDPTPPSAAASLPSAPTPSAVTLPSDQPPPSRQADPGARLPSPPLVAPAASTGGVQSTTGSADAGPGSELPDRSSGPATGAEPPAGGSEPEVEPELAGRAVDAEAIPEVGGGRPTTGPGVEVVDGDPTAWPPDEAFDAVELDDRGWVRRNLEAILLVADEPVPATVLAEIVGSRLSQVEELLVELAGEYARDGRGFVLRAIAGGWRLYTHPGARATVEAFLRAGQQSRLTRAALETLAVIAYRQPVTRFQVAAIRGVNVDGVFRTLSSRGLIQEVGSDPGPGQATLYGTTAAFLEQLGLHDLDQLPPIKDYLPEGVDLVELEEQP